MKTVNDQSAQVDALAVEAKSDPSVMLSLWESVERFIRYQAQRRYTMIGGSFGGCEVEDLVQSGYIALAEAVEDFDPDRGPFLSILILHLKSAFNEAAGIRTSKRDALLYASSLNEPIDDEDPDTERIDLISDQAAEAAYRDAEEKIFIHDLHRALKDALASLPPRKREIIKRRYFDGAKVKQIAQEQKVSQQYVCALEREAIRQMRQQAKKTGLSQFVDMHTDFYRHCGVESMKFTHTSSVEAIFFQREQLRGTWEAEQRYTVIQ